MNKGKITYITSAAILAVVTIVVAAKTGHKFRNLLPDLYYTTAGITHSCVLIAHNAFQTNPVFSSYIIFVTNTGGTPKLFTSKTPFGVCQNQLSIGARLRLAD
jgi:hypothetical protein